MMSHHTSTWDQFILISINLAMRLAFLDEPPAVVFDELHYGRLASLYVNCTFYFDSNPPLFVMLIALVGYLAGFDGTWNYTHIGEVYKKSTPIWCLRLVPALCGSLIIVLVYKIMLELRYSRWTSLLAAFLITIENGILVQSRFMLMEAPFICCLLSVLWMEMKFSRANKTCQWSMEWWACLVGLGLAMTSAVCTKYMGFFTAMFALVQVGIKLWDMLPRLSRSEVAGGLGSSSVQVCLFVWRFSVEILQHLTARLMFLVVIPIVMYVGLFYVHLMLLNKSGPHDEMFTSAFQASLKGGLSEITRGQPSVVSYGSQITLRRTHGTPCWLRSHDLVYPQMYADGRGSSLQQQVTCNTLKGVDNWWIVKNPNSDSLYVDTVQPVKHLDIIQLSHGMTGRLLNSDLGNLTLYEFVSLRDKKTQLAILDTILDFPELPRTASHDVAAPVSPHYQEVSCYIEYEMSLPELTHWQVIILDVKDSQSSWKSVTSLVHLVHVNTSQALRTSGQRLGAWGFQQLEVVTDRIHNQPYTVWNVEEHKYSLDEEVQDHSPLQDSSPLGFWAKFLELQSEMFMMKDVDGSIEHVYSSDPWQWPLMSRNIVYWFNTQDKSQIHLLGNPILWFTSSGAILVYLCLLVFYVLRRKRGIFDVPQDVWEQFAQSGGVLLVSYLMNYVPYLFTERTTFIYQYLSALVFQIMLLVAVFEHLGRLVAFSHAVVIKTYLLVVAVWLVVVCFSFVLFGAVTYGKIPVSEAFVSKLKWLESWDFIL